MDGKPGLGEKKEWRNMIVHRLQESESGVPKRKLSAPQDGPHTAESGQVAEDVHVGRFLGIQSDRGTP